MRLRQRADRILVAVGLGIVAVVGYVIFSLRECQELWNVRRGSALFRLCGMGSEPIAAVPVTEPVGEVGYARRMRDGEKPTVMSVDYASAASEAAIRGALTAFLAAKGFALARREDRYEWWSDGHGHIGFQIRAEDGGKNLVDVMHLPDDE